MLDRDYAIQLAMEYGFTGGFDVEGNLTYDSEFVEAILEATAKEREACAVVCDSVYHQNIGPEFGEVRHGIAACAQAIRARGGPTSRGEA